MVGRHARAAGLTLLTRIRAASLVLGALLSADLCFAGRNARKKAATDGSDALFDNDAYAGVLGDIFAQRPSLQGEWKETRPSPDDYGSVPGGPVAAVDVSEAAPAPAEFIVNPVSLFRELDNRIKEAEIGIGTQIMEEGDRLQELGQMLKALGSDKESPTYGIEPGFPGVGLGPQIAKSWAEPPPAEAIATTATPLDEMIAAQAVGRARSRAWNTSNQVDLDAPRNEPSQAGGGGAGAAGRGAAGRGPGRRPAGPRRKTSRRPAREAGHRKAPTSQLREGQARGKTEATTTDEHLRQKHAEVVKAEEDNALGDAFKRRSEVREADQDCVQRCLTAMYDSDSLKYAGCDPGEEGGHQRLARGQSCARQWCETHECGAR